MASSDLTVFIGNHPTPVGILRFNADGRRQNSTFAYSQAWQSEGFPLCPAMPLRAAAFFVSSRGESHQMSFPGPVADACPDAWGRSIIRRDRSKPGITLSDLDFLSAVDDETRPGALRFKDATGVFVSPPDRTRPTIPPIVELEELAAAVRRFEKKESTQKDLARLRGLGASLGGARPKANVIGPDGSLYIAKFSVSNESLPTEKAEVLTLKLARLCGLNAPDAAYFDGKKWGPIALVKRFDRTREGGRMHYISAQTMLDAVTAVDGSYTELAAAIRSHCHDPLSNLRELFGRVAFTVLVTNVDDHLKNHGFLHVDQGRWTLSPLFDVNPAPERDSDLKTWISPDSGAASLEVLIEVAPQFGLRRDEAISIIGGMSRTISAAWRPVGRKHSAMTSAEIKAYADAFEHDQAEFALGLPESRPELRETKVESGGEFSP